MIREEATELILQAKKEKELTFEVDSPESRRPQSLDHRRPARPTSYEPRAGRHGGGTFGPR